MHNERHCAGLGIGRGAANALSHLGPIYVGTIIYVVGALVALFGLSQTAPVAASA
jgi:hypothetical protein